MTNARLSYRQIMVGRSMTGLVGLDEALASVTAKGITVDDPSLGRQLLALICKHNYVPSGAVQEYERALVAAYVKQMDQADTKDRDWRDPRKVHLNWYPVVLDAKCDGCGECIAICPRNVLGWNKERTVALVLEPYECAPGCTLCSKSCRRRAIVMPPREALHHLYRIRSG